MNLLPFKIGGPLPAIRSCLSGSFCLGYGVEDKCVLLFDVRCETILQEKPLGIRVTPWVSVVHMVIFFPILVRDHCWCPRLLSALPQY